MSKIIRSDQEIAAEITALEAVKPLVPAMSTFGDDNIAAIDASIDVLKTRNLDTDRFLETNCDDEGEFDEPGHVSQAAYEVVQWLTGERDTKASTEWRAIAE